MIPDAAALVDAVRAAATNPHSHLHGEGHWKSVAWTGLHLAPEVSGCDPVLVFLFGLLHDCKCLHDGYDRDHGRRAGAFARGLNGHLFHLAPEQAECLGYACDAHADGGTSADPTIGLCWDADRLNLWRIGARPDPQFLSTGPAKRQEVIRRAAGMEGQHLDWGSIFQRCKTINATR